MAKAQVPINGATLKRLRAKKKLSQQELAEAANIPIDSIQNYESHKNKSTSAERRDQLAEVLGVEADVLGSEPPSEPEPDFDDGDPTIRLVGEWTMRYTVTTSAEPEVVAKRLLATQEGEEVVFSGVEEDRIKYEGRIESHYLTGTWRDDVRASLHFGAFQVVIQNTRRLVGAWVGFNRHSEIAHGVIEFDRSVDE
ncbi:MAG: helix-turn-helix domain-containing protein [Gemmataceae bacterium]|nr:helix-turn-helix domain-containing protein [Gemmataceae bacterium]